MGSTITIVDEAGCTIEAEIIGVCNIGDGRTCPDCGGWKDPDEDLCEECATSWEDGD